MTVYGIVIAATKDLPHLEFAQQIYPHSFLFFYHTTHTTRAKPFFLLQVAFLARFMTVYGIVIAATKDLPDVEGDRKGGIETFATRLGTAKVSMTIYKFFFFFSPSYVCIY